MSLPRRCFFQWAQALALLSLTAASYFCLSQQFVYSVTSDRDLYFGKSLAQGSAFIGPHAGMSERIPGGAYYLILNAILHVFQDPNTIMALIRVAYFSASIFLATQAYRVWGLIPATLILALLIVTRSTHETLLSIWNSAAAAPLVIFAVGLYLKIIRTHRVWPIPIVVMTIAVATQIHFISAALFLILGIGLIANRVPITWKMFAISIMCFLGLYVPFLIAIAADIIPTTPLANFMIYGNRVLDIDAMSDVRHCMVRKLLNLNPAIPFKSYRSELMYGGMLILSGGLLWKCHRIWLAVIGIGVICLMMIPNCEGHYLFFLTPILCLGVGAAYAELERHHRVAGLIFPITLAIMFFNLRAEYLSQPHRDSSIEDLRHIRDQLSSKFRFQGIDFETKVTRLEENASGAYEMADPTRVQATYLTRDETVETDAPCIRVYRSRDNQYRLEPYRLPDGNCLKNMTNGYIYLPQEVAPPNSRRWKITIPIPGTIHRTLPVSLDLKSVNRKLRITLSSNRLRGYGENGTFNLVDPKVIFENHLTKIQMAVAIFDGTLGRSGFLAPWNSKSFTLPKGTYRLTLQSGAILWQNKLSATSSSTPITDYFAIP